jgi:hypothetical protein
MKKLIAVSLLILAGCASDPVIRMSFYNDLETIIAEKIEDTNGIVRENNIEEFNITSYVTIGTWPIEINKNTIERTLLLIGYNDRNILLYIYTNENHYILTPELLSDILVRYGILDKQRRIYQLNISDLINQLGVNTDKYERIEFYYRQMRLIN